MLPVTLIVAVALGAGSSGSSPAPPVSTAHHLNIAASASLAGTFKAEADMTLTALYWNTSSVGVGLGANQTVAIQVNGVSVCQIVTPCTSIVGFEDSMACNAPIPTGADVDIVRSGCALGISVGTLTYVLVQ